MLGFEKHCELFHKVVITSPMSEKRKPKLNDWGVPSHSARMFISTHIGFQGNLQHSLCSQIVCAIWYSATELLQCDITTERWERTDAGTQKWLIINAFKSTSCISPKWPVIPQDEPIFPVLLISWVTWKGDESPFIYSSLSAQFHALLFNRKRSYLFCL